MKVKNLEKLVTKVLESMQSISHYSVNKHSLFTSYCLIVNELVTKNVYYLCFFENKLTISKSLGEAKAYYQCDNIIYYYCSSYDHFLSLIYNCIK